jgi:peroxisomal enoyl-CoA hydratase 2
VVLALKGDDQDLNLFSERVKGRPIEGIPPLDPNRVVHGTQSIEILKQLPLVSGEGWKWKSRYTGVVENSEPIVASDTERSLKCYSESGLILMMENQLVDPNGEVYARLYVRYAPMLMPMLFTDVGLPTVHSPLPSTLEPR